MASKPVTQVREGDVISLNRGGQERRRVVTQVQEHTIGRAKKVGVVHIPADRGGGTVPVTSVFRQDQAVEVVAKTAADTKEASRS